MTDVFNSDDDNNDDNNDDDNDDDFSSKVNYLY